MFSNDSPNTATAPLAPTRPRRLSEIYRPAQSRRAIDTVLDRPRRLELMRKHGDFSLAYTTAMQSRLRHFGDENGYIAYDVQRLGYVFALGDPVAAPEHRESLIKRFVKVFPRAAFCQTSAATARMLQQCGYYVNEMGVDAVLPLPEYDFQGQDKRWIRQAASWTNSRGYTIREDSLENVGVEQVAGVSLAWRAKCRVKEREVRFLNRPLVLDDEPGTRRFFIFSPEGELQAFIFFDPLFRDGRLLGYVACTKRRHPDAPANAEPSLMKHAIETFQREGCREFRLGLSPFAGIEDREFRFNRGVQRTFRFLFSSPLINRRFYNLQGQAEYKQKYRGRDEAVYFATPSRFNALRLMALAKVCKVV